MYRIYIVIFIVFLFSGCMLTKKNKNCDAYAYKEKVIKDNNGVINQDSKDYLNFVNK